MTRYIKRHSLLARVIHFVVVVSCGLLILSGFVVFVPALSLAVGHGVVQALRLLHRIFAVSFIVAPLVGLIVAPQGFMHIVKNLLTPWDADDKKFMKLFPRYLFRPQTTHMPPQREIKSGQRLADGALLLASLGIAVSGLVLWAGSYVPPQLFQIALLIHDITFFGIVLIMCTHIYLGAGIFQPYRGLANLMFGDGMVAEGPARYHWGHWAEEELASGANVIEK
jgi:formate dehydrogenase subunit gamma